MKRTPQAWYNSTVPLDWEMIGELCRRRCAFAVYKSPGGSHHFCMQRNGGIGVATSEPAFAFATYNGSPRFIACQLDIPPAPSAYSPLPCPPPCEPATNRSRYHELFSQYMAWMHGKQAPLHKVVLARTKDVMSMTPSAVSVYLSAAAASPRQFQALLHTPDLGTWVCCTPEILLRGSDHQWNTMALAGTRPHSNAPWDAKNIQEQGFVRESICDTLRRNGAIPQLLGTSNLQTGHIEHLCSSISFQLPWSEIPRLLKQLPPTPAVSGYPQQAACALMARTPDISRRLYAGYLGPWGEEHTELYVALRCMEVLNDRYRIYAGGGLLPESTEENEWRETEEKIQTILPYLHETAIL